MTLFEELKWRGLIHNITDEKIIDKIIYILKEKET